MLPTREKIKTLDELLILREQVKQQGKKVVTTNGSYDIVHAGHIRSLEESKAQGDILMVGINSDSSVKQYKSPDRPIIPEQYRAEMIAGLECVDYVFIFDELNPIDFVNKLKPDVHTNSADYGEDCVEAEAVKNNGGKLYLLKKYEGYSTSLIIDKVLQVYCQVRKEVK
jgi:rfaE bifunctional protein nucleotidyltransferase chain/domain